MLHFSRRGIAALAIALALAPAASASPTMTYSTSIDLGASTARGCDTGEAAIDRDAGVVRNSDGSLAYRFIPAQGSFKGLSPMPWDVPDGHHHDYLYASKSTPGYAVTLSTAPDLALYTYSYWDGRSMVTTVSKAERGEDGTWEDAGALISGRDVNGYHDGASIVALNSRGQVLLTANDGYDSWYYGVHQSEHAGILVYDANTGKGTRLEWLLPRLPFGDFRNVAPIALDEEGRVLARAWSTMTRDTHLLLFSPSDLPATPVPEPSTLVVLALGGLLAHRRLRAWHPGRE